jgi:hypothetical protein
VKHASKQRKYYTALSRKIAVGLASGLLFVGIGEPASIALAHPDPSTTGIYSTTGDVTGGMYTVEQGSGLAVPTEAAGGAAVNPDKPAVSVTNSSLTVNGMLSNSGYGGYSYRDALAVATAAQNSLSLTGTIQVTADDDRLYGAFGGFTYAGLTVVPAGSDGTLGADASGNTVTGTGEDSTFRFVTNFGSVTIPEVTEYSPGTISPEAGLELKSALAGGYAVTSSTSTEGAVGKRNAQSVRASAVADNNTVTFSTLNLQPVVEVTGQDGSQGQAIEYRSMVTVSGGQAMAVNNAKGSYVDHSDTNIASSDGNSFTVGTLNLEEAVQSVSAELEQTTTLSGGDALARYQSPSSLEKLKSEDPQKNGKVSIITESYQNTTYNNIINKATADNNTETLNAIILGGKLNTETGTTPTDVEAEGELEVRAGHAEAIVFLNDTDSKLDGLENSAQANGNTLTVSKVEQNIEQSAKQDEQGTVVQASTVTLMLHGGNARTEMTQNGTNNVNWKNVKSSAAANSNTITLEDISSNVTESSLTGGAATSDILLMEGTGTMEATVASNTASASGNTAQMGLNAPVNMGLGCTISGGVADVSVAGQNNFNNDKGTDNGLTMTVEAMNADSSSNTIKAVGKIDSSGNNLSAATTITANGGSATAGLSFVGATTATYISHDKASWQNGSITATNNTVDLTTAFTYTASGSGTMKLEALPSFSAMGGSASGSLGNMNVQADVTLGNLNLESTGNKISISNSIDITGAPKGQLDTSYTLTGGTAAFGVSNTAPVLTDAQGNALTVAPQPFNINSAAVSLIASNNTIDVKETIKGTAGSGSASSSAATVDTIEGGNATFTYLDDVSAKSTVSLMPTFKVTGNTAAVTSTDTSNGGVASIEGSTYSGGTAASSITSGKAPVSGETTVTYTADNKITHAPTMTVSGNTLTLASTVNASADTGGDGTAVGVISGGRANLDIVNYGNNTTFDVSPRADVTGNTAQITLSSTAANGSFTGLARAYGGAAEMNVSNGSAESSSKDSSGTETKTPASKPEGLSFTASPVLNASGNALTVQDMASDGASASKATGVTGLYGGRSAIKISDLGTGTKSLALSSAKLSADNNTVTTNRSAVDVYGGQAAIETDAPLSVTNLTMSASGNEVNIDGNCAKDVYGGNVLLSSNITLADTPNLSADNNTVNYNAGTVLGVLYGGLINNGGTQSFGKGNTLNVRGTGLTAKNIAAFNTVNFYTAPGKIKDTTLLTLNGGQQTDLSGTQINTRIHKDSELADGDVVHLLSNDATIKTDATTDITNPTQGAVIEYKGAAKLSADGKSLDFTAESRSLIEQSKSLTETRAAAITLLNSGADFFASAGITNAVDAAAAEAFGSASSDGGNAESGNGSAGEMKAVRSGIFAPFAAMGGSDMRAKSGSYVDTRGWNINAGFSRVLKNKNGTMTFGPIVEYGWGNYTSHLDDGTLGFGDSKFFGAGVFLRQNNTNGLWYEGSLRAGHMKSDYRGNLNLQNVTYDTSNNYFAAHLGIGKVNKVSEKGSLDLYTKLFYAHQGSAETDLSTGEHFDFGTVNSVRWRVGGKYTHQVSKTGSMYAGLAYEYEFKGNATATYQGLSTPSPSVKGGSGLLELGYRIKPGAKSPMTLDFGLNLWTGKRRGIGGVLSANWKL